MRARQNRKPEAGAFNPKSKRENRKRKTESEVSTPMVIVGGSETSCSGSYHQLSSNIFNPLYLSSVVDNSSHSQLDNFDFPWGNLDMPMDLSQIEFEIKDKHGVDFELLAQKNHERWLANLEMADGRCE